MEHSVARSDQHAWPQGLMGAAAVAALCGLAACSANGGQRTGGGYRTGATGEALSRAAGGSPAELARVQAAVRRNAPSSPTARSGRMEALASRAASSRPTATAPAANPRLFPASSATAQAAGRFPPTFARASTVERASATSSPLVERALTSATLLAPALSDPGAVAPPLAATERSAPARWSLSRAQMAVLALGLLLSIITALVAAWSVARRRRAPAEPRILAPVAANDPGHMSPPRSEGPQLALPLSPAGAPPRTYSASASARLSSRRP